MRHLAEVFFAGNAWPQSLAYPGDIAIGNRANDRCANALPAYAGSKYLGVFAFDSIAPDKSTWVTGDRLVTCIAYRYDMRSVNYSIRKH